MHQALDSNTGKPITVDGYRVAYGSLLNSANQPNVRPPAKCPVCGEELHIKGESGTSRITKIFSHNPVFGVEEYPCPIKEGGRAKYEVLTPTSYDPASAAALRASFFSHWQLHWHQFRDYIGYAKVEDFIELLNLADDRKIWGYHHLKEYEIPLVLLILKDFAPIKKKTTKNEYWRKHWVRFWFPSSVKNLDDYWNLQPSSRFVIKAYYTTSPSAKLPNPKHFLKFENIILNKSYLTSDSERKMDTVVEKMMTKAFPIEIAQAAAETTLES
ncbi:hypothetical protein AEQ67_18125 [Pseudomonas sp. RIT-PI-q]|uniref:hypothetical protein n=1 Tax=Pseudomonas sp. RIT-PI-q TaxID=1690247 RepID=UPI0006CC8730|nr:hypothetical protein [Pseudomonas sp. RIT-PI-q]KPG95878.1 hypothetical protein AEQ67_18125 [Pseudomonas sp. RIT-PI-q]